MDAIRPLTDGDARHRLANRLLSHFGRGTVGRNVFVLTDGSVSEVQPSDASTIRKVLRGGCAEPITSAESSALSSAGYGAYIS